MLRVGLPRESLDVAYHPGRDDLLSTYSSYDRLHCDDVTWFDVATIALARTGAIVASHEFTCMEVNIMVIKAEVKSAKIGPLSIEGLMSENGDFAVAVPQASERFQIASNQASRSIKTLLGTGFQFDKWKSPLHPKEVNVLSLSDFEKLMVELAFNGNEKAREMVRALTGLSLYQLFCDAFGKKFEAEDRQRWLETSLKDTDSRKVRTTPVLSGLFSQNLASNLELGMTLILRHWSCWIGCRSNSPH